MIVLGDPLGIDQRGSPTHCGCSVIEQNGAIIVQTFKCNPHHAGFHHTAADCESPGGHAPAPAGAPCEAGLYLQRRTFLVAVGGTLMVSAVGVAGAGAGTAVSPARGLPFDDGTWFDDGYGWTD